MKTRIRLEILSGQDLIRECLTALLHREGRFEIAAPREGSFGPPVDLLLVDLSYAATEVLDRAAEIHRHSAVRMLFVGIERDPAVVLRCVESGGRGLLMLDAPFAELRRSINRVLDGKVVFPARFHAQLFGRLRELSQAHHRSVREAGSSLTARERDVLGLLAQDLSNAEIAERLSLSTFTVMNHVKHILKKLSVSRRREAVDMALRHGWLKLSESP